MTTTTERTHPTWCDKASRIAGATDVVHLAEPMTVRADNGQARFSAAMIRSDEYSADGRVTRYGDAGVSTWSTATVSGGLLGALRPVIMSPADTAAFREMLADLEHRAELDREEIARVRGARPVLRGLGPTELVP